MTTTAELTTHCPRWNDAVRVAVVPPAAWENREPTPSTTSGALAPHAVPCEISMQSTTARMLRIPGTQRGVALLRGQRITALWRPSPELMHALHAFVVLGHRVHVVWVEAGRDVGKTELTACDRKFSTVDALLWSHQQPPCTGGAGRDCMRVWRSRYA